jgi:hypothetical protein
MFEVSTDTELLAKQLQNLISEHLYAQINECIERCFDSIGSTDKIYKIDTLTIDLGNIKAINITEQLVIDFEHQLTAQIHKRFQQQLPTPLITTQTSIEAPFSDSQLKKDQQQGTDLELIQIYLMTAHLPWWADVGDKKLLARTLATLLKNSRHLLRSPMLKLLSQKTLLIRLVETFGDDLLYPLLDVLVRGLSVQQTKLVNNILSKINEVSVLTKAPFRKVRRLVWQALFEQLCLNHGRENQRVIENIAHLIALELAIPWERLQNLLGIHLKKPSDTAFYLECLALIKQLSRGPASTNLQEKLIKHLNANTAEVPNNIEISDEIQTLINTLTQKEQPLAKIIESLENNIAQQWLKEKSQRINIDHVRQLFNYISQDIVCELRTSILLQDYNYKQINAWLWQSIKQLKEAPNTAQLCNMLMAHLLPKIAEKEQPDAFKKLQVTLSTWAGHQRESIQCFLLVKEFAEKPLNTAIFSKLAAIKVSQKYSDYFYLEIATILKRNAYRYANNKVTLHEANSLQKIMAAKLSKEQVIALGEENKVNDFKIQARQENEIYIDNAGLVILWPYIDRLFENLELINKKQFIDQRAQQKALSVLQYIVDGDDELVCEHTLALNKVICGLRPDDPFISDSFLSEHEKTIIEQMLMAVIANASMLKNSSIEGLRCNFLSRKGRLSAYQGGWLLQVEKHSKDVVLDHIPWEFQWFKLPWMNKIMRIEW